MLLEVLIASAISAVGGGLVTKALGKPRQKQLDEYAARMITDTNFELRGRVNLLEREISGHVKLLAEKERKIYELLLQNQVLQKFPTELPIPMWSVNFKHEYDFISDSYWELFLKHYGKSKQEYLGVHLLDVWPQEVGSVFIANNTIVMETGYIFNQKEDVALPGNVTEKFQVLKFPRKFPLGLIGVAFPLKNGLFDELMHRVK